MDAVPFGPVYEPVHADAVIVESPYGAVQNGRINQVPMMVGVTSLEGLDFNPCMFMMKFYVSFYSKTLYCSYWCLYEIRECFESGYICVDCIKLSN